MQFSSKRKGIRAWNFRMMIRKIWRFFWYQNRNNFEKNEKRKDQAPLIWNKYLLWNKTITNIVISFFLLFSTDDMIDVIGYNSDSDRSSSDLNNGSDGGLAVSSKEIIIQQFWWPPPMEKTRKQPKTNSTGPSKKSWCL